MALQISLKDIKKKEDLSLLSFVPGTGLEPAHLAAYAPETYASTNSAIRAFFGYASLFESGRKNSIFFETSNTCRFDFEKNFLQ